QGPLHPRALSGDGRANAQGLRGLEKSEQKIGGCRSSHSGQEPSQSEGNAMERTIEQRTLHKVAWRLLPLIVVIYFIAYMDRTNVSFASLSMNKDLGFSDYIYGWGAHNLFSGYFLFEVPSNVILEKTGARIWIARIMITWGIAAA